MRKAGGTRREAVREPGAAEAGLGELGDECQVLRAHLAQSEDRLRGLAASQALWRGIFERSLDGIVLTDEDGRIIEWNEAEERIAGIPAAQVLGRPLWDVQLVLKPEPGAPGERERLERAIRKALRTGEVPARAWSREMPIRRPNGETRYVQSLVFAIDTTRGHRLCAFSRDVTDRHRAEEALRESETRFRHLVETSSDVIWEVNSDGVYTYMSPSVREVLGYEPEELLGKTVLDLLPPEDAPRFEALFRSIRDEHRTLRFLRNRNVRKDGQIVELETNAVPFFDEAGRLAGYRGMDRDVTARVRAEEGLRLLGEVARVLVSSLDYERVLQEMARLMVPTLADWAAVDILVDGEKARPVAVAHVDPWKEELARELQRRYPLDPRRAGYGAVVFGGDSILYPEVDLELLKKIAHDEEHLRMNQQMGPRSVIAVPLLGRERPLGALLLLITESRRRYGPRELALAQEIGRRAGLAVENARLFRLAQQARGEAERRAAELEGTISAVVDGLLIYGPGGEIVRMNRAAEELLSYTPEERALPFAERMALLRFESPEGRPYRPEDLPMARALRGETVQGAILAGYRPRDRRKVWITLSAAPIRGADGEILGAVATFVDITAIRELQEQREDLIRAVSHDLRNPLAAIQGQAELLLRALEKAGLTGRERQSAEAILKSVQRMNTMIQDLVDSARLEARPLELRRQTMDLVRFVAEVKERLTTTMETGRIRVLPAEGLPPVSADPDRLERVLANLFSNALKYSTPGTEVTVTFRREGNEVVTAVTDRGPGIAPEDMPRLFQRYFRAPGRAPEGLGLGLYISRLLVEAHGGRIWAESQVGVGSTFSFSVPVAREEKPSEG